MTPAPRDLPGLYWDESRNRYFPLASRPKQPAIFSPPAVKQYNSYRPFTALASSYRNSQLSGLHHQILCSRLSSSTNRAVLTHDFPNIISAFSALPMDHQHQHTYTMVGDNNGWLYSMSDMYSPYRVSHEFSLSTAISSISSSGSLCVATTFGSPCKIVVCNTSTTESFILSPPAKSIYDIWTAHFRDGSLALGMHNRALYIPDVSISRNSNVIPTYSDVLAIHQQPNLVYTGTRSGILSRWDTRTRVKNDAPLFGNTYSRTSIIYVEVLDGSRIVISTVGGDLDMFDLRYPKASMPVVRFQGHVNSYSQKLAFAVDPFKDFLFAAGQDNRIRSWSVRTGELLTNTSDAGRSSDKLFDAHFEEPISALQIIHDQDNLAMLISSGNSLSKYHLFSQS